MFADDRRSFCVRDATRDDAAFNEREVNLLDRFPFGERDGLARLSVHPTARPDHRGRSRHDVVATGGHSHQPVVSFKVSRRTRHRRAIRREVSRIQNHSDIRHAFILEHDAACDNTRALFLSGLRESGEDGQDREQDNE